MATRKTVVFKQGASPAKIVNRKVVQSPVVMPKKGC